MKGKFRIYLYRSTSGLELGVSERNNSFLENYTTVFTFDKIDSYTHESLVIRDEKIKIQNSISEYSVYGIILTNENNIITNKSVSFLVRTKNQDSVEGGIIEGAGAIDIPCLLDIKLETNLNKKIEITAEEIQKYLDDLKAQEEAKKKEEEEAKKKEEDEKKEEEEAKKKEEDEKKEENAKSEEQPNNEG